MRTNHSMLYLEMIALFSIIISPVVCKNNNNKDCIVSAKYDYIVIGAGTAGSIVASELSKNNLNSVLLIEEGGWSSQWEIINNAAKIFQTWFEPQIERGYISTKQEFLNNRYIPLRRANVTGGCNSHNVLNYNLGQRQDFDQRWGNIDGWKWNDLQKYWNHIQHTFKTHRFDKNDLWIQRFIQSGIQNGYKFVSDQNNLSNLDVNNDDIIWVKQVMGHIVSSDYAQRESSWTAYIEPILGIRDNLDILVYTKVNKILFKHKHKPIARGVETIGIGDKQINTFYARKEVIICAGAIDTPKLLMLSGVGDCNYLESLNIDCISNVPAIGSNLQEHLIYFMTSPPLKDQSIEIPPKLFSNVNYGTFAMKNEGKYHISLNIDIVPYKNNDTKVLTSIIGLFRLKSRGEILLSDNNPNSKPIINPNLFNNGIDEQTFIDSFLEARNLLYSNVLLPFYEENADEILPGLHINTNDEILEFGRNTLGSFSHFGGTCKMGNKFDKSNLNQVVVDNKLKVRGIKNLRIIDHSIVPNLVHANTNQITMIIGFKGADMILNDH